MSHSATSHFAAVSFCSQACGKVLLLGEHAVVYGKHALAAPVPDLVRASACVGQTEGVHLSSPAWGIERPLDPEAQGLDAMVRLFVDRLGLGGRGLRLRIEPQVAKGSGLGGSAALAVALLRALDGALSLGLSPQAVNELAFESEKLAHGTPSGVDNTVATYGQFLLFRGSERPLQQPVQAAVPLHLVIGHSGVQGLTAAMVQQVRQRRDRWTRLSDGLLDTIDALTLQGAQAIEKGDLVALGELMDINHGLLAALGVSCGALERLVDVARRHGALGAKLTGGGGGGAMVALCADSGETVASAMRDAGFRARLVTVPAAQRQPACASGTV